MEVVVEVELEAQDERRSSTERREVAILAADTKSFTEIDDG